MDYRNQHPWEEEGWNALEPMLDQQMPVASRFRGRKYINAVLWLFCFFTVAGWGVLDYRDHQGNSNEIEKAEPNMASADLSYAASSNDVELTDFQPENSSRSYYGDLLFANAGDYLIEDNNRMPYSVALNRFSADAEKQLHSLSEPEILSQRLAGIRSLLPRTSAHLGTQILYNPPSLSSQVLTKPSYPRNPVLGSFVEVHIQNQNSDLWGGGVFFGLSYTGKSPWQTSFSVGYQYLKSRTLEADGAYSVPLVLPGSNPDNPQTNENIFPSLDLPQVQIHAHRIGFTGQFDWNIAGRFGLGAIARASLDWYTMNPDLSNSSIRYYYPDLGFNKRDEPHSYFHLGAGINSSYKLGSSWSIQLRGMLTKSFTGLNTKPSYIDAYIWSLESGVRYQF